MGITESKRTVVRTGMVFAFAALTVTGLLLFGMASDALAVGTGAGKTVHITGKTFRFGKRAPTLVGAVIKVREFPKISTVSDANGDYDLEVPDNANVTPYIVTGWNAPGTDALTQHYNEIDLQTFHTRGEDLENANFQTPTDLEYIGLKVILDVPADADGRPDQCVIVTTSSARNVRGVSYDTYWDRTPHGVAGASSHTIPAVEGPIYFNDSVLPDKTWTSSSHDGGIVWRVVPTGTYRVITEHPTTRFASFLATCAPGRIVNANPPWGAYELAKGERPLGASNVAAKVVRAKAYRKKKKRWLSLKVKSGEQIEMSVSYSSVTKPGVPALVGAAGKRKIPAGTKSIRIRMPWMGARFRIPLKVSVNLKDASGVSFTSKHRVTLPKLKPNRRR